ncbi:MAG: hypothetical protein IPK82_37880 [Polyangiaceae bacterium]|nr:hypothetical protein [Polyangiaceae bacterium]
MNPTEPKPRGVLPWLKRHGKWLLLALGVVAVTLLIRETGPAKVWATVLGAGAHLPIIIVLEAAWISMDTFAVRAMLGGHGRDAPAKLYLRSALVAYGIMVLLPAGRPGGEVARAAILAPHVGGARAGAAAARINGVTLFANALISIPCFIAIAMVVGAGDKLSIAVLANAAGTAFLGLGILIVTRTAKVGGFLGKRFRSMVHWGPAFDEALREMPAIPYKAIAMCFFGRFLQMIQYAVILHSVGGKLTLSSGLVTQGIHLVGAMLGDMVPNQVGFHEAAYRIFADALGLGNDPARAVSIALIARIAQFSLAGASLVATALWKADKAPAGESKAPNDA